MAKRYDIDLDSLWTQSRTFRFNGRLPTVKAHGAPSRVVPFSVLAAHEIESHGDLAFGPDHVVFDAGLGEVPLSVPILTAHTAAWKAMDQRLHAALHEVLGQAATPSVDGVYDVMVQDDFSVTLRPIDDVSSHRVGVLMTAQLAELPEHDLDMAQLEQRAAQASALLPLGDIVVGAPVDLAPLDQAQLELSYMLFVDHADFHDERAADVLRQGVSLAHHVRELVESFGIDDGLVAALRPLPGESGERPDPADAPAASDVPTVTSDLADLRTRLASLNARYFSVDKLALRRQVLRYLNAIGCDIARTAIDAGPIRFAHRGIGVRLDLVHEPIDCVNVQVTICKRVRLTDSLMRTLLPFFQSLVMGSLVVLPAEDDAELCDIIFGDTVLAAELDLDELVLAMANVLLTGMTLRETVSIIAGIEPPAAPDEALPSLAPLFTYLEARRGRATVPVDFEGAGELRYRLDSYMRQLGLWPRLGHGRNIVFRHGDVVAEVILRQDGADTFVTCRAIIFERLETGPLPLLQWLLAHGAAAEIGGYKLVEGGLLAFEDTVLGNSIDLNEFAHTLATVAEGAAAAQTALLAVEELQVTTDNLPRERTAPDIEAFVDLYRQSTDPVERCKAIQALTLLGASCRLVAIDAVLDPHPVVADFAAASLIASEQTLSAEPDVRNGALRVLAETLETPRYCDPTRLRVLRALAGLLDGQHAESAAAEVAHATGLIIQLALNPRESLPLRLEAIGVLPVLGTVEAFDALLQLIEAPHQPTTHAALSSLAAFELTAEDQLPRAAALLESFVQVASDLAPHVVELCIELNVPMPTDKSPTSPTSVAPVPRAPGPIARVLARRALADADAADQLRALLESSLGELRHQAVLAIVENRLVDFAQNVVKALKTEIDPFVTRKLLIALAQLGGGGLAAHEALERYVNDDHLRVRALMALRRQHR